MKKEDEVIEFLRMVMRGDAVDNVPVVFKRRAQALAGDVPAISHRMKAAELLGKHYALFNEKPQSESAGVVHIINNIPRDDRNDGA